MSPQRRWALGVLSLATVLSVVLLVILSTLRTSEATFKVQVDSYKSLQMDVTIGPKSQQDRWPTTALNVVASRAQAHGPLTAALMLDERTNAAYTDLGLKPGLAARRLDLASDDGLVMISILYPSAEFRIRVVDPSQASLQSVPRLTVAYDEMGTPPELIHPSVALVGLIIAGTAEGQRFDAGTDFETVTSSQGPPGESVSSLSGALGSISWSIPPEEIIPAISPLTGRLYHYAQLITLAESGDGADQGTLLIPHGQPISLNLWSLDQATITLTGGAGQVYVNGDPKQFSQQDKLTINMEAQAQPSKRWLSVVGEPTVSLSGYATGIRIQTGDDGENLMPTRLGVELTSLGFWAVLLVAAIIGAWISLSLSVLFRADQQPGQ